MIEDYGRQTFVHTEPPSPDRVDPIENRDPVMKPAGGMWTSSCRNGTSPWVDWVRRENWAPHPISEIEVWELEPVDDPELAVIDSVSDLERLLDSYGRDTDIMFGALDYELLSKDYDGVWVTTRGEAETRFSEPNLYGYDCESTLWFDWCFESVEPSRIEIDN